MTATVCCHDLPMQAPFFARFPPRPARRRLAEQAPFHTLRRSVGTLTKDAIASGAPQLAAEYLVQRLARAKAEALVAGAGVGWCGAGAGLRFSVLVFWTTRCFWQAVDAAEASRRWRRMAGQWGEHPHRPLAWRRGPAVLAPLQLTPRDHQGFIRGPPATPKLTAYVATGRPLHCAGGLRLEGRGGLLVEQMRAAFSNVIGLSLPRLRRLVARRVRPSTKQVS